MGCFSTCFGKSKRQRRHRRRRSRPFDKPTNNPCLLEHLQKHESIEEFEVSQLIDEEKTENPIDPCLASIEEKREKVNLSGRKKVTFDLNVKIYDDLPKEQEQEHEQEQEKVKGLETESHSDSSSSSLFTYPSNHRYQNYRDSDDEFDEVLSSDNSEVDDYTDDEDDDEDYDDGYEVENGVSSDKPVVDTQEQSSESLFSLSLDSRKKNLEAGDKDKEVNSPMTLKNSHRNDSSREGGYNQSKYADSVLNPVENLTQWKVIKARSRQAKRDQVKENHNIGQDSDVPVRKEPLEKEVGVDTSLSTWLIGSEAATTPNSRTSSASVGNSVSERATANSYSPKKFEDRPILGALTVEEIRQFSATSSPRKSPGRSPDDMPIIGTVGSYWSHTGQTTKSGSSTKSKSRFTESTQVIWDSTPFETRLEKALEKEGTPEQVVIV